jgi:cell division protein ZapA
MNKQIEVQIMGQSYLLGCPDEGEAPLRDAVGRVDAAMCKIRDAGKVKARDRIAVLASLNLAFDLVQCEARATALPAPSVPAAATAPAAASATASDTPSPDDAISTDPRAAQLLARLDQALAGDGHLL